MYACIADDDIQSILHPPDPKSKLTYPNNPLSIPQLTTKQDYEALGYYTWLYEGSQTMRCVLLPACVCI